MKKLFLFALSIFSNNLLAEPIQKINFNYYYIYPKSLLDLEKELNNRSPIRINKIILFGNTDWSVTWDYKWINQNGTCRITTIKTNLNILFTVPTIPNDFVAPLDAKIAFTNFFKVLMLHENKHMMSGLSAAREIESSFHNISYNCNGINLYTNELGKRIIEKYNKVDIDYDNSTNHGETEGANIKNFTRKHE